MPPNTAVAEPSAAPAKVEPKNPVVIVGNQVKAFLERGSLYLPADYSPENALKSAWLTLQETKDKDGNLALSVCSQESIINSLLDMVVQGLNPAKKQVYFIVYGKKLLCQRSYFGDQALAERLKPGIEIYSAVVYNDDSFEYTLIRGRTVVTKHETKLENQKTDKIRAAYCGIYEPSTGEDLGAEIMTIEQIKRSWQQGQTKGNSPAHQGFPDQMALRTVIRRRCKNIINSSSDALLLASIRRQEQDAVDAGIDEEVAENANGETLALNPPEQPQARQPTGKEEERIGTPPAEPQAQTNGGGEPF